MNPNLSANIGAAAPAPSAPAPSARPAGAQARESFNSIVQALSQGTSASGAPVSKGGDLSSGSRALRHSRDASTTASHDAQKDGLEPGSSTPGQTGGATTPSAFVLSPNGLSLSGLSLNAEFASGPGRQGAGSSQAPEAAAPGGKSSLAGLSSLAGSAQDENDLFSGLEGPLAGGATSEASNFVSAAKSMQLKVTRASTHYAFHPGGSSSADHISSSSEPTGATLPAHGATTTQDDSPKNQSSGQKFAQQMNGTNALESLDASLSQDLSLAAGGTQITDVSKALKDAAQSLSTAQAGAQNEQNAQSSGAVMRQLDLQLKPDDLGSISVSLKISNGKLSVTIETSTTTALDALESERDQLMNGLASTDMQVDGLILRSAQPAQEQQEESDTYDQNASSHNGSKQSAKQGRSDAQTSNND